MIAYSGEIMLLEIHRKALARQAEETGKGQRLVEAMDAAIKALKEQPEMRRAVGMLMNDEEKKIFAIQQLNTYPNCELTKGYYPNCHCGVGERLLAESFLKIVSLYFI